MNDQDLPSLYRAADTAAVQAQKTFYLTLLSNLALLTTAAALSLANSSNPKFAAIQLLCLLATLGLSIYLATSNLQRNWYGSRALAESVKTISWRYAMRAEPFHDGNAEAKAEFLASLRKIISSNTEISSQASDMSDVGQISEKMQSYRSNSLAVRKQIYIADRIHDQHTWYTRKANFNRKKGKLFFGILICINVLAILAAIGKILFTAFSYWPTDVFVAGAGGILAWIQSKRYQELSASYNLTAHEISLLKEELPEDSEELSFSHFVGDAENAFSREHTQWQARKDIE